MSNVVTPVGRLAFNKNLFKQNDKGRYSVAVVFDKDKDMTKVKQLIAETIKEKWGDKVPSNLMMPVKEETRDDMLEKYPFMADRITLNASNGYAIPVIDLNHEEIFESDLKAGDQVRLSISAYAYDNQLKGVGLNAEGVQFIREDEAFYGRTSAKDMFSGDDVEKFEAEKKAESEDFMNMGF
jgi:hypothetical protein